MQYLPPQDVRMGMAGSSACGAEGTGVPHKSDGVHLVGHRKPIVKGSRSGRAELSVAGYMNQRIRQIAYLAFVARLLSVVLLSVIGGACDETEEVSRLAPPPSECPTFDPIHNCGNVCRGYPPLDDLGTDFWRGRQGGLYPGGQNVRPAAHDAAGLALASQIQPLDVNGVPDSVLGKIVLISMGMSNAAMEFERFVPLFEALTARNPSVALVNCAQGGWEINHFLDSLTSVPYWNNVDSLLAEQGLSYEQVQVIWFKQAELGPAIVAPDTSFVGYVAYLKEKFKQTMHILSDRFPNAKICYASSRIYSGYSTDNGNPEPFAYYVGWVVKDLIEDQINGDPDLAFEGAGKNSPWLSWGPYLWADGLKPRSDGLVWVCPNDYLPDGRHPSDPTGRMKVARLLLDFLLSEETALPWIVAN
jgi:hypothetical protein